LLEVTNTALRSTAALLPGPDAGGLPGGVVSPAQYGERFKAAAVYLNQQQLIPEDRVAQTLQDLFDAALVCSASVAQWARRKTRALAEVYRAIGERTIEEKAPCLDETGPRIAGKLGWLHHDLDARLHLLSRREPRAAVPGNLKGGVVVA